MNELEFVNIFKTLGNRKRFQILRLLKREKEISVGVIASEIRLSFKATSKHLSLLLRVGLVEYENRQNKVFYRLLNSDQPLVNLLLKRFV